MTQVTQGKKDYGDKSVRRWMEKTLLAQGKIASQDMNLFGTTDDPEEVVRFISFDQKFSFV